MIFGYLVSMILSYFSTLPRLPSDGVDAVELDRRGSIDLFSKTLMRSRIEFSMLSESAVDNDSATLEAEIKLRKQKLKLNKYFVCKIYFRLNTKRRK